jgi:hypothetical protein
VPIEELIDLRVGSRVDRVAGVIEQLGDAGRQLRHLADVQPAVPPAVRMLGRGGQDDAVATADLAPAVRQPAESVAQGAAGRHSIQVVYAVTGLLGRRPVLGGRLGQHLGQRLEVVDVEADQPGAPDVDGDAVIGAGEPAWPLDLPGTRIRVESAAVVLDQLCRAAHPAGDPVGVVEVRAVIRAAESAIGCVPALGAGLGHRTITERPDAPANAAWQTVLRKLDGPG